MSTQFDRVQVAREIETKAIQFGAVTNHLGQGVGNLVGGVFKLGGDALGSTADRATLNSLGAVTREIGNLGHTTGSVVGHIVGATADATIKVAASLVSTLIRFGKK